VRTFYYHADVTQESVTECLLAVRGWLEEDPPGAPVEIALASRGGDCMAGFRFVEDLRRMQRHHRVEITTRASGYAASMASIMLQAGDRRVIGPDSRLMIHAPSQEISGRLPLLQAKVRELEHTYERMLAIYAERSPADPADFRSRIARETDWFMSPEEVLSWGLADEIA
jgi:ATP-dependent Clp protease protease subunit